MQCIHRTNSGCHHSWTELILIHTLFFSVSLAIVIVEFTETALQVVPRPAALVVTLVDVLSTAVGKPKAG